MQIQAFSTESKKSLQNQKNAFDTTFRQE